MSLTLVEQASGPDDEHEVEYAFDEANRLSQVLEGSVVQAAYSYDPAGLLQSLQYPPPIGVEATYVNDLAGRQKAITWTGMGGTFASFDWTIDDAGLRTHVTELNGREVTYEHDAVGRLTRETHEVNSACEREITYGYDAVGNRVSRTLDCAVAPSELTTYTHDDNDRLLTAGSETFEHDNNGNMTETGDATYEWDDENRLVAATVNGTSFEFEYDVDGLRQATTIDTTRTFGVVDTAWPHAQVLEERADGGALLRRYLRGLTPPLRQDAGGVARWFVQDHLGSTRALLDGNGDVAESHDYEAFGTRLDSTAGTELLFAGEEWEEEAGLTYLRARWMDPTLGAFVSEDPAAVFTSSRAGAIGRSYADLSPLSMVDPSGWNIEAASAASIATHSSRGVSATTLQQQREGIALGDVPLFLFMRPTVIDQTGWSIDAGLVQFSIDDGARILAEQARIVLLSTPPAIYDAPDAWRYRAVPEVTSLKDRFATSDNTIPVVYIERYTGNDTQPCRFGQATVTPPTYPPIASLRHANHPIWWVGRSLAHELCHAAGGLRHEDGTKTNLLSPIPRFLPYPTAAREFLGPTLRYRFRMRLLAR